MRPAEDRDLRIDGAAKGKHRVLAGDERRDVLN